MKTLIKSEGGEEEEKWKVYMLLLGFSLVLMVLFGFGIYGALEPVNGSQKRLLSKGNYTVASSDSDAKLVTSTTEDYEGEGGDDNTGDGGDGSTNRVGMGAPCSKDNILVFQGATSPMPNGIPTYTVDIQNVCLTGSCSISGIHLSCGWFSSARLVDPRIFRRIEYDDCLVNDGEALNPGEALTFQYANTFKYPLSVSSVSC